MKVDNVTLNRAQWSRHGTELEIGFRVSESDGIEHDWVLMQVVVTVPVSEFLAFERQILTNYASKIEEAIRTESASPLWNFSFSNIDLNLT